MSTKQTVYQIDENEAEDVLIKFRNGKKQPCLCPWTNALVIPDKYGIQVIPKVCGSSCPMFDVYENKVILNCTGTVYDVDVSENSKFSL